MTNRVEPGGVSPFAPPGSPLRQGRKRANLLRLLALELLLGIMRLVGSDRGLKEVSINDGKPVKRDKDGTFHVDGPAAKALIKSGDFAVAGITFQNARSFRCQDCNHNSLFRDKCGKCGGTNLVEENQEEQPE